MADNVHQLHPVEVGEGYRFDSDTILEEAKGKGMTNVVVIGELEDGSIWVSGASNAGEALILMEMGKHQLIFGDDD